jgi:hypothetical protein
MSEIQETCEHFVDWLLDRVSCSARGENLTSLDVEPEGRFWLGRLAPQAALMNAPFGDRSERMQPCAIGMRLRPSLAPPWEFNVTVSGCAWKRIGTGAQSHWDKTAICSEQLLIRIGSGETLSHQFPATAFEQELRVQLDEDALRCNVLVEVEPGRDGSVELVVSMVNDSPEASETPLADTGIYESQLRVTGLSTRPFLLEALPDSFRYDRRIPAYGQNCGVMVSNGNHFESADFVSVEKTRPIYWPVTQPEPDLSFASLGSNPLPGLRSLVDAHRQWGEIAWSNAVLDARRTNEGWSEAMRTEAAGEATSFAEEAQRLARGLSLLESNSTLLRSFQMMNEAMGIACRGRYSGWRPFQIGFLLANLASVLGGDEETGLVDILWFATGGGKTETYLGLLVIAAFHDRLTGKSTGITAWSRFPLRLLSLQQTQRFANALAGAEIVRRRQSIPGDPFSLGFFVGDTSTPNRIKNENPPPHQDPLDESMPARFQVLFRCPFCDSTVSMSFDRLLWRLEHRCTSDNCPWPESALPIYVVDEEIYRYLPTVIVGTLDKVASISMQAAMRGFVGAPNGLCSQPGHGFVYAPRSTRPNGCLVPGCRGTRDALPMSANRFPPTFRLQDELHLLRDSLGAIDAHYESLLDHLEIVTSGVRPKIVASSATLTGYQRQCDVLYRRTGRVFPLQGPTIDQSFWSGRSEDLLRRYVALAPRGATLEFAADRMLTDLQQAIRSLLAEPARICAEIGIDPRHAALMVSLYGVDVVYGNSIRDLDASVRSLETQVPVSPLITAQLTGHTPFPEVRSVLERLENPEEEFNERIHVVAASSMMSHGVDINRLNTMVMLGTPLTTAEFIQATARIGRTYPGIVFVMHKMPLERDASVYRSFQSFIEQGDRFVESIPITRRSRRVLERTIPGLLMARILHIHEPAAPQPLTIIQRLRQFCTQSGITPATELAAITGLLQLDDVMDNVLREEAERLLQAFFTSLHDPATSKTFPSDLFQTAVMRSLRDVEEQAPIYDR